MKKANGSYYLFIDSDDWIEKEMVEDLLKLSKANKTDITMCTIVSESEFKTSIDEFPWKDNKIFDKSSVLKEILPRLISKIDKNGTEIEVISGSVCRCLYKAEMLKENNIFFDVSIGSGQDKEFNLRAFFKAERILTVNKPYYHYNRRTSHGGSTTQNFSPGLYENAIRRQGKYIDTLKKENLYKEFKKGLDLSLLESVIASINNLNYNNTPYNIFQRVKVTKEILRNSNFGEQIKKISKEEKVILGRNKIILLNSPFLYLSLNSMKLKIKKVVLKTR